MSYSGLGVYQQQPPPRRPNRAPLWIALAVVGVLVVGGATAFALLGDEDGRATPTSSTSSSAPEPGWAVVEDDQAGVRYELPPSWERGGKGSVGRLRVTESHVSRPFECQGRNMIQAQAVSGSVAGEPEEVAAEVVTGLAGNGYTVNGTPPEVGEPRVETSSDDRVVLSVEVTPKAANACYAPKATITAVALRDGSRTAVFAVNVAQGGPHVAQGPSEDDVRRILGSVRLP
ncbi:hypothetical protein [Saccharothrix xinjiangensis]|uniref:DUF8017 domain-containing protein n=1 Tax=Saccharothrix xinjiangensis TaxID=204798 RepID=A0ABV9XT21_9PSEU